MRIDCAVSRLEPLGQRAISRGESPFLRSVVVRLAWGCPGHWNLDAPSLINSDCIVAHPTTSHGCVAALLRKCSRSRKAFRASGHPQRLLDGRIQPWGVRIAPALALPHGRGLRAARRGSRTDPLLRAAGIGGRRPLAAERPWQPAGATDGNGHFTEQMTHTTGHQTWQFAAELQWLQDMTSLPQNSLDRFIGGDWGFRVLPTTTRRRDGPRSTRSGCGLVPPKGAPSALRGTGGSAREWH